ncbi:hypothetical protein LEP1GSC024_0247 [Leptospira noguchii str. 2001034031]|uniref:Uncharacterized protein n=1 Tax=Leptospira noguchii str. 2001034031 TaxID=1193053 RepID=M6Y483_9LEPT|nr:hypothetical protein LEP1GSC024_0247 [Leptospira noguchii str. 2001034031]
MFHRPGMKLIGYPNVFTIINKYLNTEVFYISLIFQFPIRELDHKIMATTFVSILLSECPICS